MNTSEHNADLFPANDTPSESASFSEMRFRTDDVVDTSGPAADAANDLGSRLKAEREARGMELQTCGQKLRLPVRVLAKLEAGDLGRADDHVFTRGALQSYAKLLNVPVFAVDAALRAMAPAQQPALVPTGNALRGNWMQRYGSAATYIVLTAFVAVPLVWLGLRGGLDNQLTRIAPLDHAPVAAAPGRVAQTIKSPAPTPKPEQQQQPLMASMTPFSAMNLESAASPQADSAPQLQRAAPAPTANSVGHVLSLSANGDSWFEVTGADGKTLDSGMLRAGDTRSYHSAKPLDITIGNADAVDVQSDGTRLSLDAYRRANVARFKVFAGNGNNG